MDLSCIKCSEITINNDIIIKREIDGEINLYSYCLKYGFKNFETIDEE